MKNNRKTFIPVLQYTFVVSWIIFLFSGCSNKSGTGGQASIIGKIRTHNYINNCTQLQAEYPGVDKDVYVIYGDDPSYGDRVKTAPDGTFWFRYLRKGTYTVYIYSDDCDVPSDTTAIKKQLKSAIASNRLM